eukprot:CAMPEP_0113964612 /NCGR_PEP_ID=MMETSP0011_2-20120614/7251_1 /TAXON_ID=101924 /ORGANISM="Rhodosorus marinus" /LENGTH=250 /DNA_ID=CAMNT_0000976963 /DNA_START=205 /DNA_END=954 /DNA_ORIENTATION=+ /assembly_acc=CAM_ASM_000156
MIVALIVSLLLGLQLLFMLLSYRFFRNVRGRQPRESTVEQSSTERNQNAIGAWDASSASALPIAEQGSLLSATLNAPEAKVKLNGESSIVSSESDWNDLALAFPSRFQMSTLTRLFSTDVDGFSLAHMCLNLRGAVPSLLLFEDANHARFGAFCMGDWSMASELKSTGTGENFVFKFDADGNVQTYPWSRTNKSYQIKTKNYIAVGTGREGNAIRIDSELLHGTSSYCETFTSPTLSSNEQFECLRAEAW